jgi:ABC-2 type transport system ATP-binding protein
MRRRLEIARSLMHAPRVLFMDEPSAGLDPVSRLHLWDMIRRVEARTGVTLFLTTHDMEEAEELCAQVAVFDHGAIVARGSPASLKAHVGGRRLQDVLVALTGRDPRDAAAERHRMDVRHLYDRRPHA